MRKLTQLVLLATVLVASPAFAEMKIAVLNYQMALLESDAAKKYAVDAEKPIFILRFTTETPMLQFISFIIKKVHNLQNDS